MVMLACCDDSENGRLTNGDHSLVVQVLFFVVKVCSFRWLTNAIKAIYLHIRRKWQAGLKRVHPFRRDELIVFDLFLAVRDAMAV